MSSMDCSSGHQKVNEMVSLGDTAISFHFGGYSWVVKTQSTKFWPKFHWGGGYSWVVKMRIGILGKMSKDFAMPYSGNPYITDSCSHTMFVKTNESLLRNENFRKPLDIFLFKTISEIILGNYGRKCSNRSLINNL